MLHGFLSSVFPDRFNLQLKSQVTVKLEQIHEPFIGKLVFCRTVELYILNTSGKVRKSKTDAPHVSVPKMRTKIPMIFIINPTKT